MEELPTIQELSRGEASTSGSYASTPLEAESAVRVTSNMLTSSSLCVGSSKDLRLDVIRFELSAENIA